MARRQAAESANAGLKRAGADIGKNGHFKVFGRAKLTFLLAFEIAADNERRAEAFDRDQESKAHGERTKPRKRASRRRGTYSDIIGADAPKPPKAPPDA